MFVVIVNTVSWYLGKEFFFLVTVPPPPKKKRKTNKVGRFFFIPVSLVIYSTALEGMKKLGLGRKSRVGQVTRNNDFFYFIALCIIYSHITCSMKDFIYAFFISTSTNKTDVNYMVCALLALQANFITKILS